MLSQKLLVIERFKGLYKRDSRNPLRFENLKGINPATFNLLVGSLEEKKHEFDQEDMIPSLFPESRKIYYHEAVNTLINSLGEDQMADRRSPEDISYILFGGGDLESLDASASGILSPGNQINELKTTFDELPTFEHLFHIMSFLSDIRHPICSECCEKLLNTMSKHFQYLKNERDAYIGILNHINNVVLSDDEVEKIKVEIGDNLKKEAAALETIAQLKKKQQDIEKEVRKLNEESLILDKEEEIFWKEKNSFLLKLQEFQNERDALNLQYDYNIRQLEELKETNVYKDIFCISHSGQFGTINDLKFGCLPSYPVNWDEINAAWGFIAKEHINKREKNRQVNGFLKGLYLYMDKSLN
ncbi:hypothetical protein MERGE_000321 [Pneumocystis wakefieldiae]|uniref:Autophagy-related protein 6 n=1 Tax=Pneumocystis wakefieldiae TaxID=38082 RepID=A0A899FV07_9ASCO|nr:hypothetical protein MERGE_000321 [Pneumocystis wakefieldiae]